MRFVDEAIITVRSGHGGHGCVSFRREKFIPKGGPDGGDGGRGGAISLRAEPRMLTLYDFRHKRLYAAQNGQSGQGSEKYGKAGEDLVVDLPVGTLVYTLREDQEPELLVDLSEPGLEVLVAKGGRGGKGNTHFKSATMRAPRFAQPGEPGEEKRLKLVLKILADVGLIGLPNAGKSTLISQISAARPKIAPYPFTTLTPNLGVLTDDYGRQLVVADIPGLIEGAHEGQGLGDRFLRHVERTRLLVHVLSAEEVGLEAEDPFAGFGLVNAELAAFSPELAEKPQLEVVNKIDIWPEDRLARAKELAAAAGREILFISALGGEGLEALVEELWRRSGKSAAAERDETEDETDNAPRESDKL